MLQHSKRNRGNKTSLRVCNFQFFFLWIIYSQLKELFCTYQGMWFKHFVLLQHFVRPQHFVEHLFGQLHLQMKMNFFYFFRNCYRLMNHGFPMPKNITNKLHILFYNLDKGVLFYHKFGLCVRSIHFNFWIQSCNLHRILDIFVAYLIWKIVLSFETWSLNYIHLHRTFIFHFKLHILCKTGSLKSDFNSNPSSNLIRKLYSGTFKNSISQNHHKRCTFENP